MNNHIKIGFAMIVKQDMGFLKNSIMIFEYNIIFNY